MLVSAASRPELPKFSLGGDFSRSLVAESCKVTKEDEVQSMSFDGAEVREGYNHSPRHFHLLHRT